MVGMPTGGMNRLLFSCAFWPCFLFILRWDKLISSYLKWKKWEWNGHFFGNTIRLYAGKSLEQNGISSKLTVQNIFIKVGNKSISHCYILLIVLYSSVFLVLFTLLIICYHHHHVFTARILKLPIVTVCVIIRGYTPCIEKYKCTHLKSNMYNGHFLQVNKIKTFFNIWQIKLL